MDIDHTLLIEGALPSTRKDITLPVEAVVKPLIEPPAYEDVSQIERHLVFEEGHEPCGGQHVKWKAQLGHTVENPCSLTCAQVHLVISDEIRDQKTLGLYR